MNGNHNSEKLLGEEELIIQESFSFADLISNKAIRDISIQTAPDDTFQITILPENERAAVIKLIQSTSALSFHAGKYFSDDLEDTVVGLEGRWSFALSLVTMIIKHGMKELVTIKGDKVVKYTVDIRTPFGIFETTRRERGIGISSNTRIIEQKYEPYMVASNETPPAGLPPKK